MKSLLTLLFFLLKVSLSIIAETGDSLKQSGKASFYHDVLHGETTSSGENYNKHDFTAAHKYLPFGTYVNVHNKINGKNVIVRINDRGPFIKSRLIDLSKAAAKKIGMVKFGVVPVRISILKTLDDSSFSEESIPDNSIWDCFGNPVKLKDYSILLWQTSHWKHAFYMASQLNLEKKSEKFIIQVKGRFPHRQYSVILTGISTENECSFILKSLNAEGFLDAIIIK
ncbi:MAG: septal ring lytic transglycosylase RlpA family protein [Bacteroidetes bacterium]|nr:MAG: septal ring lytic transglycosylase RlpA family protein [Bacteroidota bacterium]REK07621.1 MAG: septal ring lytic transglycosylase RlpA family protein [Bacteroidota bacterium]REK36947.1 MAG: septal ring lytic transglycosylase RlpA family protein [Bacteroidota bacterium]REK47767.1 MAG: septal ring lytic transglycosylase RlpA family protein [Bacteroidota bacterium]